MMGAKPAERARRKAAGARHWAAPQWAARAAIWWLFGVAIGCGPSRSSGSDELKGVGATSDALAATLGPNGKQTPGISLILKVAGDFRSVDVEIWVVGPEAKGIGALRATRGFADNNPLSAVQNLTVADAAGVISVMKPEEQPGFFVLPLKRPSETNDFVVRYTVRSGASASRLSLHRGEGGISAVGHSFVIRPAMTKELPLSITLSESSEEKALATSLDGRKSANVEALAEAAYVAGSIKTIVSDEGNRGTSAFGSPIDAMEALRIAKSARTFATRAFGPAAFRDLPLSVFVLGERGIGNEHDAAATGGGVAIWLDSSRQLDSGVKVVLAHEALHAVFGGALSLDVGDRDAAWFSEGFTTYYARRALFEEGLLDAEGFLADVLRIEQGRAKTADRENDREVGYALGARYAALLNAKVALRSKGKRSLNDVIQLLTGRIQKSTSGAIEPLPVATFREIVSTEIGADEEKELWLGLLAGVLPDVPDDVFGPCFKRVKKTKIELELGFDPSGILQKPGRIQGTVKGSAAEKAGVRDGALVLASNIKTMRALRALTTDSTVELLLSQSGSKSRIRYKPVAERIESVFRPAPCQKR